MNLYRNDASSVELVRISPGGVIARTADLDDVIRRLIDQDGIQLVGNLGAGLDTRPCRLPLPPRATVSLERYAVDRSDTSARQENFTRILAGLRRFG